MANEPTRCLDIEDFAVPRDDRYFEDYPVGEVHHYGTVRVTAEEIVDFGRRFDPQDMHIGAELAARSPAGELIASGIHTLALTVRILADHYLSRVATLPSPGATELGFPAPVRPGDELRVRAQVRDARASRSDPTRGVITTEATMLRADDTAVAKVTFIHLMRRRETGISSQSGPAS